MAQTTYVYNADQRRFSHHNTIPDNIYYVISIG